MICNDKRHKFWRNGEQHLIENYYQAIIDNKERWHCHHRLELTLDGEFAHTPEELIRFGMYYDRPYYELIYLRNSEHIALHNKAHNPHRIRKFIETVTGDSRLATATGKHWYNNGTESVYTYECPEGYKPGRIFNNWMKGKRHSIETRKRISEIRKGKRRDSNV